MQIEGEKALMWSRHLLLGVLGLAAGSAVAAGTFAFIVMLGILPRMVGKSRTAKEIIYYENMVVLGGIAGNLVSVFLNIHLPLGRIFLGLYGISTGIFVGCIAAALAEVLKTFPIMFRRMKIKVGLNYAIFFMAMGKLVGALWYFSHQMGIGT
jgi:stage V sporulation protein AB